MALKSKIIALTGSLIFAATAFANESGCPDLNNIKAEGLSMAVPIVKYSNFYVAFELNEYGTDSNWGFAISPVEARSEEEALRIANGILHTLNAPGIPVEENGIETVCSYDTGSTEIFASAHKGDFHISPLKMAHYPNKK